MTSTYMVRNWTQQFPIRNALHYFWILIGSRSFSRKLERIWIGSVHSGKKSVQFQFLQIRILTANQFPKIYFFDSILAKFEYPDLNFCLKKHHCTLLQKNCFPIERRNYCLSPPDVIVFVIATFVTNCRLTTKKYVIFALIYFSVPEIYKAFMDLIRNFLANLWSWNGTGTELNLILGRGNGTELVPILIRRIGTDLDPKKLDRWPYMHFLESGHDIEFPWGYYLREGALDMKTTSIAGAAPS